MIDLQRMSKYVMEHRYWITEHMSMKICRSFPLFVKMCFKNVQSPMTSLYKNLILLFEFILQRLWLIFIQFGRVHRSRLNNEKSQVRGQNKNID